MSEQSLLFQLLASVVTVRVGFALTLGGLRLLDRFGVLHQFLPRRTVYLNWTLELQHSLPTIRLG